MGRNSKLLQPESVPVIVTPRVEPTQEQNHFHEGR